MTKKRVVVAVAADAAAAASAAASADPYVGMASPINPPFCFDLQMPTTTPHQIHGVSGNTITIIIKTAARGPYVLTMNRRAAF